MTLTLVELYAIVHCIFMVFSGSLSTFLKCHCKKEVGTRRDAGFLCLLESFGTDATAGLGTAVAPPGQQPKLMPASLGQQFLGVEQAPGTARLRFQARFGKIEIDQDMNQNPSTRSKNEPAASMAKFSRIVIDQK